MRVFPHWNEDQRERLARDIWGNFGAVVAEYPHLNNLTATSRNRRVILSINRETQEILNAKTPAVYVSAHLGNWELAAALVASFGVPLSVMYSPQSNPILDRMLQKQRRSTGCRLVSKKNGLRQLLREIDHGRSVGLLSDQRVDEGEAVAFFGRRAPTATTPAWLAVKLDCPLIPVQIERIDLSRFRVIFHPPVGTSGVGDSLTDITRMTEKLNHLFEDWIRQRPDQWLCLKRRWPEQP